MGFSFKKPSAKVVGGVADLVPRDHSIRTARITEGIVVETFQRGVVRRVCIRQNR